MTVEQWDELKEIPMGDFIKWASKKHISGQINLETYTQLIRKREMELHRKTDPYYYETLAEVQKINL